MVINYEGGSKAKKKGRKYFKNKNIGKEKGVRLVNDDYEFYAIVKKIYNRNLVDVVDTKNTLYKCRIGGKFRGYNSKDNKIKNGSWILAGMRDWEVRDLKKTPYCDLLELYNDNEIKNLKKVLKDSVDFSVFSKYTFDDCDNDVEFISEENERYEDLINNQIKNNNNYEYDNTEKYNELITNTNTNNNEIDIDSI